MENISQFFHSESFNLYLLPILIFLARIVDVTVGTFRIVMVSKGMKYIAPLLGFIEVTVWILAIGKIMQNIDNWVNILAYSGGFAAGNFIGLLIEEKVAMGVVRIQIITAKPAAELVGALSSEGFGITSQKANGSKGEVSILYSIINRSDLPKITKMILAYNPKAFYTIDDVKFVNKKLGVQLLPRRSFIRKGK